MPKVSVLIPVYNAEKYLSQAIDSIINQTFSDWELIIIDDGSLDSSGDIARAYSDKDGRIKFYENEQNSGLIYTLNKGIKLCQCEYIARMDADDIAMPTRLEKQVRFMDNHADYAMCGSYAQVIDENGKIIGKITALSSDEYLRINLLFSVPFVHPSVMIRASILSNGYLFDPRFKHAEDYDMWRRIAHEHKVANIPAFLLKYRWHTTNVSSVYSQVQEEVKASIIREELCSIGLNPSEEDIQLHQASFRNPLSREENQKPPFSSYPQLDNWFSRIIEANRKLKLYNSNALTAYLWSRWIVICITHKQAGKIFNPKFLKLNFNVICRIIKLLVFLSRK
jgi:glycosyltransferase involved in cell wall biosynthesis